MLPASVIRTGSLALLFLGVACRSQEAQPSPVSGPHRVWVAVFASAADPNALGPRARDLGPYLGETLTVSPAGCFEGIPADDVEDYVLAAVAARREEVESAVAASGETPLHRYRARQVCLD